MYRFKHTALAICMLLMGGYMFWRFGERVTAGDPRAALLYSVLGFSAVGAATEPAFLLRDVSALVSMPFPPSKLSFAAYGLAAASALLWAVV